MKKIFFLLIVGIMGCEKTEITNEDLPEKQLTFDNIEVLSGALPSGFYTRIYFTSETNGYTVTNNGKIFKTEDRGYTWNEQDSGTDLYLHDIFFLDNFTGFIVGGHGYDGGVILKTTDGGNAWESTEMPYGLSNVYFTDSTKGFCAGKKLYVTHNNGKTWTDVDLGSTSYAGIAFYDDKTGFLSTTISPNKNGLLMTKNGGDTWSIVNKLDNIFENTPIFSRIQINNNITYLQTGGDEILVTKDKGHSWQILNVPATSQTYFINKLQGICVGQQWYDRGYFPEGLLCLTNNGGKSWAKMFFPASSFIRINDIALVDDSTAMAVGQSPCGYILKLKF